jgi:hypothetical protein
MGLFMSQKTYVPIKQKEARIFNVHGKDMALKSFPLSAFAIRSLSSSYISRLQMLNQFPLLRMYHGSWGDQILDIHSQSL